MLAAGGAAAQQEKVLQKDSSNWCVCVCVRCSLLEHCRRHRYLSQSGEELALLLSSQLENLLAYRTITHDESPEHRMSCTVNVLVGPAPCHAHFMLCAHLQKVSLLLFLQNFYKEKKREDIYIR